MTSRMEILRLAFVLFFTTLLFIGDAKVQKVLKRTKRNHVQCRPNSLVRYRLTVHTLWSKQIFPKMFPTYRPHAQWSSLEGRTHGPEYQMWVDGENATLGVKLFAEQGDPSQLNVESVQGYDDILDSFVAPPVNRSVGQTSAVIILDGHHSKLSFMMKIIPSPDWFIGVSSLDLCSHGRWKNKAHFDLHPLDSGTDQGLTFTAPNWPNAPAKPISAITSSFPDHPASSFFYSEYEELPRLAYLDLDIISEFRHRETFMKLPKHYNASTVEHESMEKDKIFKDHEQPKMTFKAESKHLKHQSTIDGKQRESVPLEQNDRTSQDEANFKPIDLHDPSNTSWIRTKEAQLSDLSGGGLKTQVIEDEMHINNNSESVFAPTTKRAETLISITKNAEIGKGYDETTRHTTREQDYDSHNIPTRGDAFEKATIVETESLPPSIESNAHDPNEKPTKPKHFLTMTDLLLGSGGINLKPDSTDSTHEIRNSSPVAPDDDSQLPEVSTRHVTEIYESYAVDCEVGEWSEWSTCSQTCGFGQQERLRNVSSYPQNGGANCPRLRQTNWCGSMRNCAWNHFSFLEPDTTKRLLREGRSRRRKNSADTMS